MTTSELRELLAKYPDDMPITASIRLSGSLNCLGEVQEDNVRKVLEYSKPDRLCLSFNLDHYNDYEKGIEKTAEKPQPPQPSKEGCTVFMKRTK